MCLGLPKKRPAPVPSWLKCVAFVLSLRLSMQPSLPVVSPDWCTREFVSGQTVYSEVSRRRIIRAYLQTLLFKKMYSQMINPANYRAARC